MSATADVRTAAPDRAPAAVGAPVREPLRVAQIIGITGCGGVESVIWNNYLHIDREKVQFDFFVESTSKIIDRDTIEKMGGRVYIIPPYRKPLRYISALRRIFRENRYDIVHVNMNAVSALALYAAKREGIRVRILHNHNTWGRRELRRNLIKAVLRPSAKWFATEYWACSEKAAVWMYGKKRVRQGKVHIWNNAVDVSRFACPLTAGDEVRAALEWGDAPIVGHIGRFVTQKNHTFLMDIFAAVHKKRPDARLLLLGDGPLLDKTKKKAETLGLLPYISFAGVHKHTEKYYAAMDVFVLPSLYEGLPVVGVEAQAAGLPALFSDKITAETLMTPEAEMVPLSAAPEVWADKIIARFPRGARTRVTGAIPAAFNIREQGERLTRIYEELSGCDR